MKVFGDEAKLYRPVDLSTLCDAIHPKATLTSADEDTGEMTWTDHITGAEGSKTLGQHKIKLIRR